MSHPAPASGTAPVEWSKKALAAAVFGLLGFVTVWLVFGLLAAALAAILGHLARHETSTQPLRGRGFATFGLWLGYFSMLSFPVLALIAAAAFPAWGTWRAGQDSAQRAASLDHASRLFVACEDYARANRDRYPSDWNDLAGRYLPAVELDELLRSPHPGGARVAFEIVPHDRPVLPAISDSIIVIQEIAPPLAREIAVVYANGQAATLHNPAYDGP